MGFHYIYTFIHLVGVEKICLRPGLGLHNWCPAHFEYCKGGANVNWISGGLLPRGTRGVVTIIDADGDAWAKVHLPQRGELSRVCLYHEDFGKLESDKFPNGKL